MSLYIYAEDSELRTLLARSRDKYRSTDSGFDVPMRLQYVNMFYDRYVFDLGIKIAVLENQEPAPSLLLPRSSLSKTQFRLSNSIGLIDMGYRGNVLAAVDVYGKDVNMEKIESGTRLFQICRHNFMPWSHIYIVDVISYLPIAPDSRGIGGFGSTN